MPEVKDAGSAKTTLDGTEIVLIQEAAGGTSSTKHTTVSQLPGGGGNFPIAEASVTNLVTDLTALQTQTAIQAAQIAARTQADLGYYVGQGCLYSANSTPTKLDCTAGTILVSTTGTSSGTVEARPVAQTAISTTIASLADATNPKWVWVEIDNAAATQFNSGTAAASPAVPSITAGRAPAALIYVPANATNVDTLLTTANGLAKLIDMRVLRTGVGPAGWQYDANTWVYASATSFTIASVDATGYLTKGTRVSWNDGTNVPGYGVVASSAFSTNTTVTLITTSDYSIANATIIRPRFSYGNPQGFPTWFNWSPTLAGYSANPTNTVNRWKSLGGNDILIAIRQSGAGTSNNTTHTATLPVTAATITNMQWLGDGGGLDNSAICVGQLMVASAGTTVALRNAVTATNVNSGTSSVNAAVIYEF